MEKRLFLAIALSLIIVWGWSAITPKPLMQKVETQFSETIGDKEVIEENKKLSPSTLPISSSKSASVIDERISERIEVVESDKLKAEFSNIGALLIKVTIKEHDASLPIKSIVGISEYDHLAFTLDSATDNEAIYSYEDSLIKIIKSYRLLDGEYIIESGVEISNKENMSKLINYESGGYLIEMSNLEDKGKELDHEKSRDKSLLEYAVYSDKGVHRKAGAFKFSGKEKKEEFGKVYWSGFRDRYFCAIIVPRYDTKGYKIEPINDKQLRVSVSAVETTIPAGGSVRFDSIVYVGPEKRNILKEYGLELEKIKKYYRFGLFDGVALIIEGLMQMIYNMIPNWGVCIIIISIIIYFSMYPLTLRGMLSMRKMQSLQPVIAKLKEKHKDNPQKMNKEMMELYKEHKVNPLGGCLPMLLQMPVFIGLYQVLWRSVSFKGAEFLWIKDLSQPDRLFTLPFTLPFIGNEFNILPLVMVVVMYFQQKLSTKNIVITDPAQLTQQKMMTTIMPVFLGFIFYKFASGLTLYFTMFYFFSTFTQWKMSKAQKGA